MGCKFHGRCKNKRYKLRRNKNNKVKSFIINCNVSGNESIELYCKGNVNWARMIAQDQYMRRLVFGKYVYHRCVTVSNVEQVDELPDEPDYTYESGIITTFDGKSVKTHRRWPAC